MMKLTSVSVLARRPKLAALFSVKFCRGAGGRHGDIIVNWTWTKQPHVINHCSETYTPDTGR